MNNADGYISQKKLRNIVGGTLSRVKKAVAASGVCVEVRGRTQYVKASDVGKIEEFLCRDLQPEIVEIDPLSKAWLAGFFDAEGSVSISVENKQKSYTVHWDIGNTDKHMMDRVSSILNKARIPHRCVKRKMDSRATRPVWRIQITSAREILMASHLILSSLRGARKCKMEIVYEWATKCLELGHHRGEKHELACEYARKLEGVA